MLCPILTELTSGDKSTEGALRSLNEGRKEERTQWQTTGEARAFNEKQSRWRQNQIAEITCRMESGAVSETGSLGGSDENEEAVELRKES